MRCIRIGYGKIASIHEQAFSRLNVETIGVLDSNPSRTDEILQAGFLPLYTLEEAIAMEPHFFDICTSTQAHAQVLQAISTLNPYANILIEKPICDFEDIARVNAVLAGHKGHIIVNENYCSSEITRAVKDKLLELAIQPTRVVIEMTKHRGQDYQKGRFVDSALGALGYEGSHLLALAGELGEAYVNGVLMEVDIDSIHLTSAPEDTSEHAPNPLQDNLVCLTH